MKSQNLTNSLTSGNTPALNSNSVLRTKITFSSGDLVPSSLTKHSRRQPFNLKMNASLNGYSYPPIHGMSTLIFLLRCPCSSIMGRFQNLIMNKNTLAILLIISHRMISLLELHGHLNGSFIRLLRHTYRKIADLAFPAWRHRAYNLIYREWFRDRIYRFTSRRY